MRHISFSSCCVHWCHLMPAPRSGLCLSLSWTVLSDTAPRRSRMNNNNGQTWSNMVKLVKTYRNISKYVFRWCGQKRKKICRNPAPGARKVRKGPHHLHRSSMFSLCQWCSLKPACIQSILLLWHYLCNSLHCASKEVHHVHRRRQLPHSDLAAKPTPAIFKHLRMQKQGFDFFLPSPLWRIPFERPMLFSGRVYHVQTAS